MYTLRVARSDFVSPAFFSLTDTTFSSFERLHGFISSDHFRSTTPASEHDTIIRHDDERDARRGNSPGSLVRASSIRHGVEEPPGAGDRGVREEPEQRGALPRGQGRLLQALPSSGVGKRFEEPAVPVGKLVCSLFVYVFAD